MTVGILNLVARIPSKNIPIDSSSFLIYALICERVIREFDKGLKLQDIMNRHDEDFDVLKSKKKTNKELKLQDIMNRQDEDFDDANFEDDNSIEIKTIEDSKTASSSHFLQHSDSDEEIGGSKQFRERIEESSSDSETESDDVAITRKSSNKPIPGEYNPEDYQHLDVSEEIKDLFQYITKYTPQQLNLDYKFKPFIPDFIPAVGDIDAFIKVIPPEPQQKSLGLFVLDEPAALQSEPALLHLQLRATSVLATQDTTMMVKKVDNAEKNVKTIEKWIKDVSDLHRTKSAPVVKYSNKMPELDDLMQEWPEDVENVLKYQGFPNANLSISLSKYIEVVCLLFDIPVYENKIESLHVLFSLFAAIKNSQLYKANRGESDKDQATTQSATTNKADQLVLD